MKIYLFFINISVRLDMAKLITFDDRKITKPIFNGL